MGQAVELQAVRAGLPTGTTAALVDGLSSNPIGVVDMVLFLAGSLFGVLALAACAWRAGLPKPAAVLFGVFPVADLALHGRLGTIASHLLLLAGLAWLAVTLWRRDRGTETVPFAARPGQDVAIG